MSTRLTGYTPIVLLLVAAAATACNDSDSPTTPTFSVASAGLDTSLRAEPSAPTAEILDGVICAGRPAFGVGLTIIIAAGDDLILRGIRFVFADTSGRRVLPDVVLTPIPIPPGSSLPTTPPVSIPGSTPLPGLSPIPVPGSSPIHGLAIAGGASRSFPFFLTLGCDLSPEGTIVVSADTADRNGTFRTSEFTVRLRQP